MLAIIRCAKCHPASLWARCRGTWTAGKDRRSGTIWCKRDLCARVKALEAHAEASPWGLCRQWVLSMVLSDQWFEMPRLVKSTAAR
jgi:hypothetical protein